MAGPLDLTGQNIENTYQRILQTDGTRIYNGTGSLVTLFTGSFTGSFSGSFTGSLLGTASWAINAVSSSFPIRVTGSTLHSVSPLSTNNPNTNSSIFLGGNAGASATNASNSNFIGNSAGYFATNAANSNFLGAQAGQSATGATNSNFLGSQAGLGATNAAFSNFLGYNAGSGAGLAAYSNFLGQAAGQNAVYATSSNFIGQQAGFNATSASYSSFIGFRTGEKNTITSHSIFIGYRAGLNYSNKFKPLLGPGAGPNNIIIGNNITLDQERKDSINIGAIIFATGSYSQVYNNDYTFSGSVGDGKVGINVVDPQYALDVSGSINLTGNVYQNGAPLQSSFLKSRTPANATSSVVDYDSIFNPSNLLVQDTSVFIIDSTSYYYVLGDLINSGSIVVDGTLKIGGTLYNVGSITGTGTII